MSSSPALPRFSHPDLDYESDADTLRLTPLVPAIEDAGEGPRVESPELESGVLPRRPPPTLADLGVRIGALDTERAAASEAHEDDPFGGLVPIDDPSYDATPTPFNLFDRQSIPRVVKASGELATLPIDHRAGFLLTRVDGTQTVEEILDVCAMSPDEALELMAKLRDMGVIEFE